MDTFTHALVGAVTARATAPVSIPTPASTNQQHLPIKHRVIIGGLAAAFPDSDFITAFVHPLAFITDWHRAETHSLIMLPLWALLLGFIFASILHRRSQWREFAVICALSLFSHILTDLITSWGTQVFAPLSKFAPALSITFIIDPYFTAIIAIALLIATVKNSTLIARLGLITLASYIGLQAGLKQYATLLGHEYIQAKGFNNASVSALPQPFSPFNWKLIIREGEHYHMTYVDLITGNEKPEPDITSTRLLDILAYYRPATALHWKRYSLYGTHAIAREAWLQPVLKRYQRFARYPALYKVEESQTEQCVWFMDLRFILPIRTTPFRYGVCRQAQSDWQLYRLKRSADNLREPIPER